LFAKVVLLNWSELGPETCVPPRCPVAESESDNSRDTKAPSLIFIEVSFPR
jgi:hypothetical protein